MSFEAFLAWYLEDGRRYELIEGSVFERLPTSPHEDVSGFLAAELLLPHRSLQLWSPNLVAALANEFGRHQYLTCERQETAVARAKLILAHL